MSHFGNVDQWAFNELSNDPLFHRIPSDLRGPLITDSIDFGIKVAQGIKPAFIIKFQDDMVSFAEKLGAKVAYSHYPYSTGALAEYDGDKKVIICYIAAISQAEELVCNNLSKYDEVNLTVLCIAHELFHYLELTRYKGASVGCVPIKYAGLITIHRLVRSSREIAAHAFVQELLSLPFSPAILIQSLSAPNKDNRYKNK